MYVFSLLFQKLKFTFIQRLLCYKYQQNTSQQRAEHQRVLEGFKTSKYVFLLVFSLQQGHDWERAPKTRNAARE
jgi:hypothetical protein